MNFLIGLFTIIFLDAASLEAYRKNLWSDVVLKDIGKDYWIFFKRLGLEPAQIEREENNTQKNAEQTITNLFKLYVYLGPVRGPCTGLRSTCSFSRCPKRGAVNFCLQRSRMLMGRIGVFMTNT